MMSNGFRKVKISLVLRVVHICLIHPLKAHIVVYLMIYGKGYHNLNLKEKILKPIFSLLIFDPRFLA